MEHKKEETKVCENACKKTCAKNLTCFKNECHCMKKLAKQLKFLMLVIITISVVSIACMMHRSHHKMMKSGQYGIQMPTHNFYR